MANSSNFFNLHTLRYKNDFTHNDIIKSGSFGEVYWATHKLSQIDYAVKSIIMANNKHVIKNSLNEVKIMAQYNHPNIVAFRNAWIEGGSTYDNITKNGTSSPDNESQLEFINGNDINMMEDEIHEIDDDDDDSDVSSSTQNKVKLFIQMELCTDTLEEWMRQRTEPTPQNYLIEIFLQILKALECIHSHGNTHHDIKPSNIFIDTSGGIIQVKVGDFGLSCISRELCYSGPGSLYYAAPERMNNQCDPKNDIYSLGVVLVELVFFEKTYEERTQFIRSLKYDRFYVENSPNFLVWGEIIKFLLNVNLADRPSAHDLVQEFEKLNNDHIIKELSKDNLQNAKLLSNLRLKISNLERESKQLVQDFQQRYSLYKHLMQ